ncbi:programmed cell death 1 ligand 2 [Pelodytes ibericus]
MVVYLVLLLMTGNLPATSALFVVTAERLKYTTNYGDKIQLICKFPVDEHFDLHDFKASWEYINPLSTSREQILRLDNGIIQSLNQDSPYNGRVTMLIEELKNGQAVLEIIQVKLTDAGHYRCVLQLGGSDYDSMQLDVQASYEKINTYTVTSSDDNEISLTCQSLGFPKAEVYWPNNDIRLQANTSHTLTLDGFYNISSTIKCKTQCMRNYKCVFWNKALNETTEAHVGFQGHQSPFTISNTNAIIVACIVTLVIVMLTVLIISLKRRRSFKCFRKKGLSSPPLSMTLFHASFHAAFSAHETNMTQVACAWISVLQKPGCKPKHHHNFLDDDCSPVVALKPEGSNV